MKKLIFILFLFAISTEIFSQDLEGIEITTAVGGSQEISDANANVLNSKLENFLTQNGIVKGINSQFVLIGNLDLIQSQNAGGASGNLLMYELSVTTKLLNNADQNVFAQNSQIVKGMGDNRIKAINRVVMLASKILLKARSKPATMADLGRTPFASSSRIRSKISTLASTAIPMVKTIPAIPGKVSEEPKIDIIAMMIITFTASATVENTPNSA